MKEFRKYTVIWTDGEDEHKYTCITSAEDSAADACFYEEMSDEYGNEIEGHEIVRIYDEDLTAEDMRDMKKHYTFSFREADETAVYLDAFRTVENDEGNYIEDHEHLDMVECSRQVWENGMFEMTLFDLFIREGWETEESFQNIEIGYNDASFPKHIWEE